jgi:hypothetical protein
MITLALSMAFYYLTLQNYAVFNGWDGFSQVHAPAVLGVSFDQPKPLYFLCLLVAIASYCAIRRIAASPLGLALQAMRDNPRRLRALGYPIAALRLAAFSWNRIVIVAEDYSFPYAQILGLMGSYCRAGGYVVRKFFVPLGTKDFAPVIAQLPGKDKADAVFVVLGGADAVNFLTQYTQTGGELPIIGGTLTVDQSVLSAKGPVRAHLPGVLSAGPLSDNDRSPAWKHFVERYRASDASALPSPSYPGAEYYVSTKAAMLALQACACDLSDGHAGLRAALDRMAFDTPMGPTSLNKNRQATVTVFINEVVEKDGALKTHPVQRIEAVDQFLGLGEDAYRQLGAPSRDNPSCAARGTSTGGPGIPPPVRRAQTSDAAAPGRSWGKDRSPKRGPERGQPGSSRVRRHIM